VVTKFWKYDLRAASNEIYFGIFSDVRWYLRRGGNDASTLLKIFKLWIKLLSPYTPFIAEELWEQFEFNKDEGAEKNKFVMITEFPKFNPEIKYDQAEASEQYLRNVVDDINEINKVIKIKPKKIIIYTCPAWKYKMLDIAKKLLLEKKLEMGALMQQSMADADIKQQAKAAPGYAQKLITELQRAKVETMGGEAEEGAKIDELEYLTNTKKFFENNFGCEVSVFSADDSSAPDPGNKMKAAIPMRPAIYIE
jgi:leucyl-tRNA synthetase